MESIWFDSGSDSDRDVIDIDGSAGKVVRVADTPLLHGAEDSCFWYDRSCQKRKLESGDDRTITM